MFAKTTLTRPTKELSIAHRSTVFSPLLKIKRFYGASENAVMIRVLIAMITYLLLRLIQQGMNLSMSLQKISRKLICTLMQRRPLRELFVPETPEPSGSDGQMPMELC